MRTDMVADILFYKTSDGGRETPIIGEFYACPLIIAGSGYDCRIKIDRKSFKLGKIYAVEISLLDRDYALKMINNGTIFQIWEGRTIGRGIIKSICTE